MSKNKNIIIGIFILFIIIIFGFFIYNSDLFESKEEKIAKELLGQEAYDKYKKEKKGYSNFVSLKTKLLNKGLIVSADKYLENNEYALALKNYLKAYRNNNNDVQIIEKIASVYFDMENWKNANKYFSKLEYISEENKIKLFLSLLYSNDIKKPKIYEKVKLRIKEIFKEEQDIFFYDNSLLCTRDFSLCKQNFAIKIEKLLGEKKELNVNMRYIYESLENYKNFKIDELYYKDALVIGGLFKAKLYPITIILGENLTKDKSDYKPALKLIIQSYFELGNYKKAKTLLSNYFDIDNKDPSISYMLAIVYQKLNNYLLSNIYLEKTLKLSYMPDDIYRLQIYNYFMLKNENKTIEAFDNLIKSQEKPKLKDLIMATYYNLISGKIERGEEITKLGIKLYPTEADFYGFSGWIYIEKDDLENAKVELEKGFKINPDNILINLNLGRLEKKLGNNQKAITYFNKVKNIDNSGDIGKEATKQINEIQNGTGTTISVQ